MCGQGDDVRTLFEPFLKDTELQEIIQNIRKVKALMKLGPVGSPHIH